jgi:serine/threonine protein phosphatase PrpC
VLQMAMEYANRQICHADEMDLSCRGMATTCTSFAILDKKGFLCHVGDSRAYLLQADRLKRISKDHTLVGDMLSEGIITESEARSHPQRNIILRALGSRGDVFPQVDAFELNAGDTILLCSDGLHGCVSDDEIYSALYNSQPARAGEVLMNLALERGGVDNITIVILSI